jgi:hypothetical protein
MTAYDHQGSLHVWVKLACHEAEVEGAVCASSSVTSFDFVRLFEPHSAQDAVEGLESFRSLLQWYHPASAPSGWAGANDLSRPHRYANDTIHSKREWL